jgi:hypothetical protein
LLLVHIIDHNHVIILTKQWRPSLFLQILDRGIPRRRPPVILVYSSIKGSRICAGTAGSEVIAAATTLSGTVPALQEYQKRGS